VRRLGAAEPGDHAMKSFMSVYNVFRNDMVATQIGFLPIEAGTEREAERIAERLQPGATPMQPCDC
jgi:hypothetical protein